MRSQFCFELYTLIIVEEYEVVNEQIRFLYIDCGLCRLRHSAFSIPKKFLAMAFAYNGGEVVKVRFALLISIYCRLLCFYKFVSSCCSTSYSPDRIKNLL